MTEETWTHIQGLLEDLDSTADSIRECECPSECEHEADEVERLSTAIYTACEACYCDSTDDDTTMKCKEYEEVLDLLPRTPHTGDILSLIEVVNKWRAGRGF